MHHVQDCLARSYRLLVKLVYDFFAAVFNPCLKQGVLMQVW